MRSARLHQYPQSSSRVLFSPRSNIPVTGAGSKPKCTESRSSTSSISCSFQKMQPFRRRAITCGRFSVLCNITVRCCMLLFLPQQLAPGSEIAMLVFLPLIYSCQHRPLVFVLAFGVSAVMPSVCQPIRCQSTKRSVSDYHLSSLPV